jgi:hypothetical protein
MIDSGSLDDAVLLGCRELRASKAKVFKETARKNSATSRFQGKYWYILFLAILLIEMPAFIHAQGASTTTTDSPSMAEAMTGAPSFKTLMPSLNTPVASAAPQTQPPTITPRPTVMPTVSPMPSDTPSYSPTAPPTFAEVSLQDARFRQKFLVGNGRIFNDNEITIFQTLYQSYTQNFSPTGAVASLKIETTCFVDNQEGLVESRLRFLRSSADNTYSQWRDIEHRQRDLQEESIQAINMDYTMTYSSIYFNVTNYPILFQNWVNQNLLTVTEQMQLLGLNVTEAQTASRLILRTPSPTISIAPSPTPTGVPTITPPPSAAPSSSPTGIPSLAPTPATQSGSSNPAIAITVSLLVGFAIIAIGLLIYFRKRRRKRELQYQADALKKKQEGVPHEEGFNGAGAEADHQSNYRDGDDDPENNYGSAFRKYAEKGGAGPAGVVSPSESLVSNQSLLSAGHSMTGDSGDEADTTMIFADEFDQYKDQNLEKMRADIEGNLEGCDGMMSQAVARALIDEDELNLGTADFMWGGNDDITGPEIEASALGDVMDWLKRHEAASVEEK